MELVEINDRKRNWNKQKQNTKIRKCFITINWMRESRKRSYSKNCGIKIRSKYCDINFKYR